MEKGQYAISSGQYVSGDSKGKEHILSILEEALKVNDEPNPKVMAVEVYGELFNKHNSLCVREHVDALWLDYLL